MGQTSKLVTRCGKCGVEITSHGTGTQGCRNCWKVQPKFCNTCGKELNRYTKATLCRECWEHRGKQPPRICVTCGKSMHHYHNPLFDRCKACRSSDPAPTCVDCGKDLPRGSVSPRCWACHTERRQRVASQKTCSIEGCTNKHMAKGLCAVHYEWLRGTKSRQGKYIDPPGRVWVTMQPCQVCGYNRMRSEPHRIIAQGKYEIGNMVAVCSRCHDEIDRGLTPCPPALRRPI